MEIFATVADALLLVRVLTLKLHRTYAFLTLYSAVQVIFDVADWYLGWGSPATERIFVYSLFMNALLFPLMAWDIFEELPKPILKLRNLFGARLMTGIFVSALFSLLVYATLEDNQVNGVSALSEMAGVVLWTGCTSASLAFAWSLYRLLRQQKVSTPHNTTIWVKFYLLNLLDSILYIVYLFLADSFSELQRHIVIVALLAFNIVLTGWCIARLRATTSPDTPATETAGI